ncbi:MAG: hypothetical protein IKS67_12225, partial [Victivallales bacterium]|nr:hypothetical protein [Victivallales bacterium]
MKLPSQQTKNFELPHDVVSTCAKRDEPPSRRRLYRFLLDQNIILSTYSPEPWPTSARHFRFFRVFGGLVMNIRVHS